MKEKIIKKIKESLPGSDIEISDVSHLHRNHPGIQPGSSETHFNISVIAPQFAGLNTIARHRKIYEILSDELNTSIHALSIKRCDFK